MLDAFSASIEERQKITNSYVDAYISVCEEMGIEDVEDMVKVLHPSIVSKLQEEFVAKNMVKGEKFKKSSALKEFFG